MPSDHTVISQANTFHNGLSPAVMHDPQLETYLQSVGQRIIESAQAFNQGRYADAWMFSKNMQFHLVNSKTLNAFTTGGEHMYIYNELFQQAQSEDELAAVMAHEFAHVFERHVHKGMQRQYAVLGAAAAAGGAAYLAGGKDKGGEYAGYAAGATAMIGQFVGMSYTRDDEAQADDMGFKFYTRAGWDPRRFGDFFQHMIDKGYDKGPEFLSDHPLLKSRVDLARSRAADLPPQAGEWRQPPVANAAEFRRLQQRAKDLGQRMPTDEQLQKTQQLLAALPRSCLTPSIPEDQKQAEQAVRRDLDRARQNQKQQPAAQPKPAKRPRKQAAGA
jgi:predicted Zn-dependent protease